LVPAAATALASLQVAVSSAGGTLRLNQLWRSHDKQVDLRAKYDAGTGAPAQRPGTSAHQGGRAIDVSTVTLAFPVAADKQIDELWRIATPLGWRPVIDRPDETKAERWHLDLWADWLPVLVRRGYTEAATAAVLDIGDVGQADRAWGVEGALIRCVQSHLHRAGYDCGAIDGLAGRNTLAAMAAARITTSTWPARAADAARLLSSATLCWKP
jgi:hypothetical protein